MMSQSNPEAVARLAKLIRELAQRDEFKQLTHYAALIAELQEKHDALNRQAPGTPEHYRAHAEATRIYNAARAHAIRHKFDAPNAVMQACGYSYTKLS